MPLWDFKCEKCNTVMELMFSSYDAAQQATCPACQSKLIRQPAAGGFVVQGFNAKNRYSKHT